MVDKKSQSDEKQSETKSQSETKPQSILEMRAKNHNFIKIFSDMIEYSVKEKLESECTSSCGCSSSCGCTCGEHYGCATVEKVAKAIDETIEELLPIKKDTD